MSDDQREVLQRFVDGLFAETTSVSRLDVVVRAEALDLPVDLVAIVTLLPPGTYTRKPLVDQLNSAIVAHGWSRAYGTVE